VLVLVTPKHPYTKMLLASLPSPDPDARWRDRLTISSTSDATLVTSDSGAA